MSLLAGVARVDITPPLGLPVGCWAARKALAQGAKEPLIAQALVLSDGERTAAIVATDLVFVGRRARDARCASASRALTGIPPERGLGAREPQPQRAEPLARLDDRRAARHPGVRALRRRCSATCSRAPSTRRSARLEPARIGSAVGSAPGLSGNRVQRERPVDDSVTVIRIDRADGEPLAAVVSFAAHPITVGGSTVLWDAEYIGAAARDASRPRSRASSASSSRAAPATSRRSTGGSATSEASPHGYESRDRLGRGIGEAALELYAGDRDDRRRARRRRLGAARAPPPPPRLRRRRDPRAASPSSRRSPSPSGPRSGGPRCTR